MAASSNATQIYLFVFFIASYTLYMLFVKVKRKLNISWNYMMLWHIFSWIQGLYSFWTMPFPWLMTYEIKKFHNQLVHKGPMCASEYYLENHISYRAKMSLFMVCFHFHDFYMTFDIFKDFHDFSRPGNQSFKFHDFSRFSMTRPHEPCVDFFR